MDSPCKIVVAFDGLRASSLGAYGNSVATTSAFDQLAAAGTTFDNCFVSSHDLIAVYRSLWIAPFQPRLVVTDDPDVAAFAEQSAVEVLRIDNHAAKPAELFSQTSVARLLNAACERLNEGLPDGIVWIHSSGLHSPWDAPTQVAQSLADEDDPPIPAGIALPSATLTGNDEDGDAIFVATCRYHGQVIAIDACLEAFLSWVDDLGDAAVQLVVCGTRGFALGEHGQIGGENHRIYGEQAHVPCIIRRRTDSPRRNSDLVWLADAINDASNTARDYLVWHATADETAIRTRDWFARLFSDELQHELYVKPDDRWEANDVASRCSGELSDLVRLAASASPTAAS